MKKIAVAINFLNDDRRMRICSAAEAVGYDVDFYRENGIPEDKLSEYEIVYGTPGVKNLKRMTSLKWFCSSFAGVDKLTDEAYYPSPDVILSNSAGAYGITISEHIVMVLIMLMRNMPEYIVSSAAHKWNVPMPMRSITGSDITVLGTGNLGMCFAEKAKAMGARHIIGIRRSPGNAGGAFDETYTLDALDSILPNSHILVSTLPSTEETRGLLSRERLALLPSDVLIVNVGRGDLIDQMALAEMLQSGTISGAALDVTCPEPLPENHPLWSAPNTIITPHVSGNMSLPITCDINVDLFCSDLKRFASGMAPERLVDRKTGY